MKLLMFKTSIFQYFLPEAAVERVVMDPRYARFVRND